jgi:hypothetical protein
MPPSEPTRHLTNHQTANLLRRGMKVKVRPIDALLARLNTPGGWKWLESLMRDEFTDEQLNIVHNGGDQSSSSQDRLLEIKEIAKTSVAEASTEEKALVAMAVYSLTVASGLVHHGQLYSSRPAVEWYELFADLAGVASPHWREMLFTAAEVAMLRSKTQ